MASLPQASPHKYTAGKRFLILNMVAHVVTRGLLSVDSSAVTIFVSVLKFIGFSAVQVPVN